MTAQNVQAQTAPPAAQTYEVTVENLTPGQPFSPIVAVTHGDTVRLLNVNGAASDALAAIAQDGNPTPMVELLNSFPGEVTDVVNVGQPIAPQGASLTVDGAAITDTVSFTITAAAGDYLSFVAMLICTNDGLVGLDSANLPDPGEERVIALGAYDAGREENTEQSSDLVDACSALGPVALPDDPNGNVNDGDVATTPVANIVEHPGVDGEADLSADHDWIEVANVTIRALQEGAPDEPGQGAADEDGLVTVQSSNSFTGTVNALQNALEEQGLRIFATIDHAANAAGADLELAPTTLILVGNPNLGTPLMQASRSVAIDLPQKFLVWQDAEGAVYVTYNASAYLAQRHAISDADEIINQIGAALDNFASAATAAPPPNVTVADQPLPNDAVIVAEAVSDGPGWVVIHADDGGAPGPVIGHSTPLTDGINSGLIIVIDGDAATETLYAMLHIDAGEVGTYEFPGPDSPVSVDGAVVAPAFMVTEPVTATESMTGTDSTTMTVPLSSGQLVTPTEVTTSTQVITATGGVNDATGTEAANEVAASLVEWAIDMPTEIPAGPTTFIVSNDGARVHNFAIENAEMGVAEVFAEDLQAGQTMTMTVDLQPGEYDVYCPIGNHAAQGMALTLTVTSQ
ncbi:MAG: spondin domain-containing protein [Caldilineaceae bacterium]